MGFTDVEMKDVYLYQFMEAFFAMRLTKAEMDSEEKREKMKENGEPIPANRLVRIQRFRFLRAHPLWTTHRLRQRDGDNLRIPLVFYDRIPSKTAASAEDREKHAKIMLVLFKPWRCPEDLKTHGTWCESCAAFVSGLPSDDRRHKLMQNFEDVHRSEEDAKIYRYLRDKESEHATSLAEETQKFLNDQYDRLYAKNRETEDDVLQLLGPAYLSGLTGGKEIFSHMEILASSLARPTTEDSPQIAAPAAPVLKACFAKYINASLDAVGCEPIDIETATEVR